MNLNETGVSLTSNYNMMKYFILIEICKLILINIY